MTPEEAKQHGATAYAQGGALEANPFASGGDTHEHHLAWAAGWTEAKQTAEAEAGAGEGGQNPEETPEAGATIEGIATATVEAGPGAIVEAGKEAASGTVDAVAEEVKKLGDEGYDAFLKELENRLAEGDVPQDFGKWLEEMKPVLVHMAAGQAVSALQHVISGTDRGRMKELYRRMTPQQMALAMQGNAEKLAKVADDRTREYQLISGVQTALTNKLVGTVMSALLAV